MAKRQEEREQIIEKIKDERLYTRMTLEDLILIGVYLTLQQEKACTFERLVAECFLNFPKVFAFKRYPQWPDSLRFDRPLRTLRQKGFITGSVKHYISITELGEQRVHEILTTVGSSPTKKDKINDRSGDDRLITYLKTSPVFKKYLHDPELISEEEFKNYLRCTLETPEQIVRQNLEYCKKLAQAYSEKEVLKFLLFCEKKFIKREEKNGKRDTNTS